MSLPLDTIGSAQALIEKSQRILITPHANVDPDGLSSALALYTILSAQGKDVTVVCPDTLPESLDFLPGFEKLTEGIDGAQNFIITLNLDEGVEVDKLQYSVEDNKVNIVVVPKKGRLVSQNLSSMQGAAQFDLIIVVDTANLNLLGSLYTDHIDLFSEVPILNIDHHVSNSNFGQLQLIDGTAASATEVLYSMLQALPQWKKQMNADLATLLLTGLITDTRSFQNANTTPRSLEIAAELLDAGARQQEIIQHVYKTKPISTLKIWGRALNKIQVDPAGRIAWSSISQNDLQEMGANSKETHGILDELISTIPDADVHILFTELEDGGLKASCRSSAAINISDIAGKAYGGGGHARAAGFKVASFDNFDLQVTECIAKIKQTIEEQKNAGVPEAPVAPAETKTEQQKAAASPNPNPNPLPSVGSAKGGNPNPSPSIDVVSELTKS